MQLDKKDLEEIRVRYIKKIIKVETWKKGYTQEQVADMIWKNHNTIKPYIWWPRTPKDDSLYDLIFTEILWFDEEKIKKIKAEARAEQAKAEFGWDFMTSLDIVDKGQEPITSKEEAEKVLFKINWIEPTDEALRSVRLAIDMIKFQQNKK